MGLSCRYNYYGIMLDQYRILTPTEYFALLASIPKHDHRFRIETMLNTGMRYSELQAFGDNPLWHDIKNRLIALPGASSKTQTKRDIHLTPAFSSRLEMYLHKGALHFPPRQMMNQNLKRWGYPLVTCKTFRKTWETYLLVTHQDKSLDVWTSQGHTGTVSMNHYYQSVGRLKSERDAVRKLTEGWGT